MASTERQIEKTSNLSLFTKTGNLGSTISKHYDRSRNILTKNAAKLPLIGPIIEKVPGRKESLVLTILPIAIGGIEWAIYEKLKNQQADPLPLLMATAGILIASKAIEWDALVKRNWTSNSWTFLVSDIKRILEKKDPKTYFLPDEALKTVVMSKITSLLTYPATLEAMYDSLGKKNIEDIVLITFIQNMGDVIQAVFTQTELVFPGLIKKDQSKHSLWNIKD